MADEVKTPAATEEVINKADGEIGAGLWDAPKPAEKDAAPLPTPNDAPPVTDEEEIFDEPAYLKNNYGYDSPEVLKNELAELNDLREKAKTPAEIKFANEETKKFLSYFMEEGKEDDLFNHLQSKRLIDKAEKINIENASEAKELLQVYYKFKYKNFDENDVKDHFNDQYSKPVKPKQDTSIQTDEEYQELVSEWKEKCDNIDRRIIRDAKMVKPEISQFKQQIVLTDILPKQEAATNKQFTQKELDDAKKVVEGFLEDVDSSLKVLNDFSLTYKDEAVEIPVSYSIAADEKQLIKQQLQLFAEKGYDANAILAPYWLNDDGTLNVSRMTEDLAFLNNRQKISQKFVDDAVGKRMKEYTKDKKNIQITTGGQTQNGGLDHSKALEQVEAAIWEGKR